MDFSIFRNNLKQLIKLHGMSLRQLGFAIGIPNATLSRYVTGARNPELEYVVRIATYFGVTIEGLLGIRTREYRSDTKVTDPFTTFAEVDHDQFVTTLS